MAKGTTMACDKKLEFLLFFKTYLTHMINLNNNINTNSIFKADRTTEGLS